MTLQPVTTRGWLVVILAGGAFLRLFGIWFGLPYTLARPDEDVATRTTMQILATGDPNPHFFHWPSLIFYVFGALYTVASWLKGLYAGAPLLAEYEQFLIGRVLVAAAGTLTLLVVFRIGRRIADETTGLLAAAFLAVAILHVRESHFAMTDVVMTFLVTVCLAMLLRATDEASREALKWFGAAGFVAGLATATKYSAAALAVPMFVVFIARTTRTFFARSAWAPAAVFGACMLFGFFVASPFVLLDFDGFLEGFRFNLVHLAAGQAVPLGRGWTYHLTHSLPFGLGLTGFAAAIAGSFVVGLKYPRPGAILGSFAVMLYFIVGSGQLVFFRYVLPIFPIACLCAAVGVRHGALMLARKKGIRYSAALSLLVVVTIGPGLLNSVWLDLLLARTDSRVLAANWLLEHATSGEALFESGGKYLALDVSARALRRTTFSEVTQRFEGARDDKPEWLILHSSPLDAYTQVPAGLEALSRSDYRRVFVVHGAREGATGAVYDLQDLFFLPVWGMWTIERPGPTIEIFRRHPSGEMGLSPPAD